MTRITDEARRAAGIAVAVEVSGWPMDAGLPYHPADRTMADTMQRIVAVVLTAALPHLTDDGVAPPRAVPSGASTPQAPGATGEAAESASGASNTVAAPSSPHPIAEDIETTGFYYCETAGEIEAYNHGGFDVCCDKPHLHVPLTRRAWDAIRAMAADQTGEGATPAIDREVLGKVFNVCDAYERQGMGSASDFDKGAQRAAVDIHNALLNALGGVS